MKKIIIIISLLLFYGNPVFSFDSSQIEIHGFASTGFMKSDKNNYRLGETITFTANLYDETYEPINNSQIDVVCTGEGELIIVDLLEAFKQEEARNEFEREKGDG